MFKKRVEIRAGSLAIVGVAVLALAFLYFLVLAPAKTAAPSSGQALQSQNAAGPTLPALALSPDAAARVGDEYMALGDSVAYGVGASPPDQSGYAAVFYNSYLKQIRPGLTYLNLAIPGETAATFISRPKAKSQLDKALAEIDTAAQAGKRVSPITLTIGGNDVIGARGSSDAVKEATLEEFDTNFQKILDQLVAHTGGKSDIIVTTYYNPFGGAQGQDQANTAWAVKFNSLISQRATERKLIVADFYGPVLGREKDLTWIANGDIHPNIAGHAILANQVWLASGYGRVN